MKTVVVGGQARDIGKTSAVSSIIAALREWQWTAVKITQFGPDESDEYGGSVRMEEETRAGSAADTEKFLAAGAQRAFWLCAPAGALGEAMPALRRALAGARNAILESNSVLEFLAPDLYLFVMDTRNPEFKGSAWRFFQRADAYLCVAPETPCETGKPCFPLAADRRATAEIIEFVRKRLEEAS